MEDLPFAENLSQDLLPPTDQLLASAAVFLIDGNERSAANVLLSCRLEVSMWEGRRGLYAVYVKLTGPRQAYDILSDSENPNTQAISTAIQAVIPYEVYISGFTAKAALVEIDPNWQAELIEIARGRGMLNQASEARDVRMWNNLRFRSLVEMRIAQALDRAGVLFVPNAKARLGPLARRVNREPDFLICHQGRWGILEVDGEPFHPPERTALEQERDRLFHAHGIVYVQHYDATPCFEDADGVVKQFLGLLRSAL